MLVEADAPHFLSLQTASRAATDDYGDYHRKTGIHQFVRCLRPLWSGADWASARKAAEGFGAW